MTGAQPFQIGDRVRVLDTWSGRMTIKGWIGEVVALAAEPMGWRVRLKWELKSALQQPEYGRFWSIHANWSIHAKYLTRADLPKPPRFSTVEEADAWLEANAVDDGVLTR